MPAHPEVTAGLEDAARVLQAEGAEIRNVTLPALNEFSGINRVILCSEAWSIHAPWLRARPGEYGQLSRRRLLPGAFMTAGDYVGYTTGGETAATATGPTGNSGDTFVINNRVKINYDTPGGVYSTTITYLVTPSY